MAELAWRSSHMPCSECGASVPVAELESHTCDPERLVDQEMFQLRDDIAGLEWEIHEYLGSPDGQLEAWCAANQRLLASSDKPCPTCNGKGTVPGMTGKELPCPLCKGTGIDPGFK